MKRGNPANLNVLIVDDSLLIGARVKDLLSDTAGISVIGPARSANEAMLFIEQHTTDVILLDICMPGESGVDFLKRIKLSYPPITVIMLSNFCDDHYRKICKEYGADHFFDKSTEVDKVPEVLKDLLKSRMN